MRRSLGAPGSAGRSVGALFASLLLATARPAAASPDPGSREADGPEAVPWTEPEPDEERAEPPLGEEPASESGTGAEPDAADHGEVGLVGRPRVHLEVNGRGRVTLYETRARADRGGLGGPRIARASVPVCDAPCDRVVDGEAGQLFFVGGRFVSPSRAFSLFERPPRLTIEVRPGHRLLLAGGWVLSALGAAGLVGGGVTMTLADNDRSLLRTGGIVLGVGVGLLVLGAIAVVTGRTRVRLRSPGEPAEDARSRRRQRRRRR